MALRWPTVGSVLAVCEAVAGSLAALHSERIVHGDLKPANVVLRWSAQSGFSHQGRPILIDFESSQHFDPSTDHSISRAGTWGFIAPERYFANRPAPQSDVFSMSAMTGFLFVGRVGMYGSRAAGRIPLEIRNFLRKGLEIDVLARPSDASAWLDGLQEATARLESSVLKSTVDWPKNWLPTYDRMLTRTLPSALALDRPATSRVTEDLESIAQIAVDAVSTLTHNHALEFFVRYLKSGLTLNDFARNEQVSVGRASDILEEAYDTVSKAILNEVDQTHARAISE